MPVMMLETTGALAKVAPAIASIDPKRIISERKRRGACLMVRVGSAEQIERTVERMGYFVSYVRDPPTFLYPFSAILSTFSNPFSNLMWTHLYSGSGSAEASADNHFGDGLVFCCVY